MSAKCDYCGNYRDESCVCPGCHEETVTRLESELADLRAENERLRKLIDGEGPGARYWENAAQGVDACLKYWNDLKYWNQSEAKNK